MFTEPSGRLLEGPQSNHWESRISESGGHQNERRRSAKCVGQAESSSVASKIEIILSDRATCVECTSPAHHDRRTVLTDFVQKPLLPLILFAIVTASLTAVAVDVIPQER